MRRNGNTRPGVIPFHRLEKFVRIAFRIALVARVELKHGVDFFVRLLMLVLKQVCKGEQPVRLPAIVNGEIVETRRDDRDHGVELSLLITLRGTRNCRGTVFLGVCMNKRYAKNNRENVLVQKNLLSSR